MNGTDTAAAWLAHHAGARRALIALVTTHVLALWSVLAAPRAAAATGAAALGWTGLTDTDGVPIGDYFLSVVDTPEAIGNNGQSLSILDPSSVLKWSAEAAQTAATHAIAAWWLTAEAGLFVFATGISLWFLRFTLSSVWLAALAQTGRPIFAAIATLVDQMWLGPLAVTLCVCVGGVHMLRGRRGRGWAIIGSGVLLTVLLMTVFRDPITDLLGDHGLLAIGRATGFQLAEAARNGSYAPGQSLDSQLNALLAQLVTAAVRQPLQVFNFGMVVDTTANCRSAWSRAVEAAEGPGPGPAHAMGACGAPQALAHAQHLGAGDFTLGLFFLAVAILFGAFFWYVGITVLLVGLKALFFGVVVGPAFLVGIAGLARPAAYAKHCGWQLLLHALQMLAFTAYLGIAATVMSRVGTVGAIAVVPRMLLLGLSAVAALLLFRFIDRSFHADSVGTLTESLRGGAAGRDTPSQRDSRADRLHERDRGGFTLDGRNEAAQHSGVAQFPTVSPRPTSVARPAPAKVHHADAGTAAAEAAAALAAPEVALPAAAVRRVHRPDAAAPRPAQSRPRAPAAAPPTGPDKPAERHVTTGEPPGPSTPAGPVEDAAPLEFPTTPPRQRPPSPEGDPS